MRTMIWPKIAFTFLAASVAIASDAASAQTVNLVCGGAYHMYAPEEPMDATLEPTASSVDLANKRIITPL